MSFAEELIAARNEIRKRALTDDAIAAVSHAPMNARAAEDDPSILERTWEALKGAMAPPDAGTDEMSAAMQQAPSQPPSMAPAAHGAVEGVEQTAKALLSGA